MKMQTMRQTLDNAIQAILTLKASRNQRDASVTKEQGSMEDTVSQDKLPFDELHCNVAEDTPERWGYEAEY